MNIQRDTLQTGFFLLLLAGILVLAFFVFLPYFGALLLAAVLAVVFYPLYRRILSLVRGRENVAALVTTVCVLVILVAPLAFFGFQLFQEARDVYHQVTDPEASFSNQLIDFVQDQLPAVTVNVNEYLQRFLEWMLQHVGNIFVSTAQVVLNIFLSLLALFYLLRDGRKLTQRVIALSPLEDFHDRRIVDRLRTAVTSVVMGSLLVAVIQGVMTGIGFALFGVPNAVLWGGVTVLAALVPSVGTSIVLAPAILYLFLINQVGAAAGLLIWGMTAVGLIDNFLGPRFVNRGMRVHPLVILLAVLGGLHFFGPIGYILGPLVISFLFALLDIYPLLILKEGNGEEG